MGRGRGLLAHDREQLVGEVIHLDRGEAETPQARRLRGSSNEPGETDAAVPIPVAAEIDPREDDLLMALLHPAPDLGENSAADRLREAPRTLGTTQNEQLKLQPSWILTKARTRSGPKLPSTQPILPISPATCAAVRSLGSATAATFSPDPGNASARLAPQPIRNTRSDRREARRAAFRDLRTASWVTQQVERTATSASPPTSV